MFFFVKSWFSSNNFDSRNARKPIKGPKDSDNSLVSKKNLSQKMACWVGAQGQVKLAKTAKNTPIMTSPSKSPKPKIKNIF